MSVHCRVELLDVPKLVTSCELDCKEVKQIAGSVKLVLNAGRIPPNLQIQLLEWALSGGMLGDDQEILAALVLIQALSVTNEYEIVEKPAPKKKLFRWAFPFRRSQANVAIYEE
jgi:hypothetical protein